MERLSIDQLTYLIRSCIFEVHKQLGSGFLEEVYEEALVYEMRLKGLQVERQIELPVCYKGIKLSKVYRIDLLVNKRIIVEIKSVDELHYVHFKQLLNYLRLSNLYVGILVNFNCVTIDRNNYERVFNKYAEDKE